MNTLKKTFFLIFSSILFGLFIFPSFSYAQQPPLDLTVSPVFFDYSKKPGDVIKDKIRIRNNTSNALNLKVETVKLGADATGALTILDPKPEDTYLAWLKVDSSTLNAPSREWSDITFTLTIPQDAAYGYYWAVQIKQDNSSQTGGAANLSGAAAVPILLNVQKDGAVAKAEISEFRVQNFINEYMPVSFSSTIANQGNIHLKPRGNIFISGPGGKDLATLDVNVSSGTVLPSAKRTFDSFWDDAFLTLEPEKVGNDVKRDDNGNPVTHLSIKWDKLTHFRIGPYTATLVMVYDDGHKDVMMQSKTTFWIFPYKIIGGLVVGLLVIIFGFKWMLDSYVKSQLKRRR